MSDSNSINSQFLLGDDAYLGLAKRAIELRKQPLTPQEILSCAEKKGFLPPHLRGETMHKTLAARLSVHIRKRGNRSIFYRTAPGRYFLHSLANREDTPDIFKKVFIGNLRSKSIRDEVVLVADRASVNNVIYGDFVNYSEREFEKIFRELGEFMDRDAAEKDDEVKQFVTFTVVYHKSRILVHTRGKFTNAPEALIGQTSVGFGGHVTDSDFDMFSIGGEGLIRNAIGELSEEIFLDDFYGSYEDRKQRMKILGYINLDETQEAKQHIGVIIGFKHYSEELPKKQEMSIKNLRWFDLKSRKNNLSEFDFWSEKIVLNLVNGRIPLNQSEPNYGR